MEGDVPATVQCICSCHFNPLPPYGGRRPVRPSAISCTRFQSTPSVWRETYGRIDKAGCTEYFNPLPPYGGRQITHELTDIPPAFQSTPSVWRETVVAAAHLVRDMYFNPLPPYGGRLASDRNDVRSRHFNPLPPYGGRPWIEMPTCTHLSKFQSTPSVWRETAKLHRKAFFISPILVQSCKKGCKRLHSAPEKMIFFEKREKNSVRNLQHLSVRL